MRVTVTVPKATPTTSPSGMLWSVTAKTSRTLLLHVTLLPSALSAQRCMWGIIKSSNLTSTPPRRNPATAGNHGLPVSAESSTEGASSDQKLAETMIPAASPSMPLRTLPETLLNGIMAKAPRAVMSQVKSPANRALRAAPSSVNE